eukprot:6178064-Pleurochrysis_carterae.AAC.4
MSTIIASAWTFFACIVRAVSHAFVYVLSMASTILALRCAHTAFAPQMFYTPQQQMGHEGYSVPCRIGNWAEDEYLKAVKPVNIHTCPMRLRMKGHLVYLCAY